MIVLMYSTSLLRQQFVPVVDTFDGTQVVIWVPKAIRKMDQNERSAIWSTIILWFVQNPPQPDGNYIVLRWGSHVAVRRILVEVDEPGHLTRILAVVVILGLFALGRRRRRGSHKTA